MDTVSISCVELVPPMPPPPPPELLLTVTMFAAEVRPPQRGNDDDVDDNDDDDGLVANTRTIRSANPVTRTDRGSFVRVGMDEKRYETGKKTIEGTRNVAFTMVGQHSEAEDCKDFDDVCFPGSVDNNGTRNSSTLRSSSDYVRHNERELVCTYIYIYNYIYCLEHTLSQRSFGV